MGGSIRFASQESIRVQEALIEGATNQMYVHNLCINLFATAVPLCLRVPRKTCSTRQNNNTPSQRINPVVRSWISGSERAHHARRWGQRVFNSSRAPICERLHKSSLRLRRGVAAVVLHRCVREQEVRPTGGDTTRQDVYSNSSLRATCTVRTFHPDKNPWVPHHHPCRQTFTLLISPLVPARGCTPLGLNQSNCGRREHSLERG